MAESKKQNDVKKLLTSETLKIYTTTRFAIFVKKSYPDKSRGGSRVFGLTFGCGNYSSFLFDFRRSFSAFTYICIGPSEPSLSLSLLPLSLYLFLSPLSHSLSVSLSYFFVLSLCFLSSVFSLLSLFVLRSLSLSLSPISSVCFRFLSSLSLFLSSIFPRYPSLSHLYVHVSVCASVCVCCVV